MICWALESFRRVSMRAPIIGICLILSSTSLAQERGDENSGSELELSAESSEDAELEPVSERAPLVRDARVSDGAVERAGQGAAARKVEEALSWGDDREFGGHRFLALSMQPSALIRSFFGFDQSASVITVPGFPVGSSGQRFDVMTEGLGERLAFGFRVSELLAVDAFGKLNVGYGPDGPSLLFRGGYFRIGGGLGATFRILRNDSVQLSLRPYVSVGTSEQYNVLGLVEGARQLEPDEKVEEVLQQEESRQLIVYQSQRVLGASLLAAWVLNPALGVQASVSSAWSRDKLDANQNEYVRERTTNYLMMSAGFSVEYDFWLRGIAMAMNAEYLGSYGRLADNPFPTEKSRISHRLGGGVYYTGRKDLQLGVSYYSVLGLSEVTGTPTSGDDTTELDSDPVTLDVLSFNVQYIW